MRDGTARATPAGTPLRHAIRTAALLLLLLVSCRSADRPQSEIGGEVLAGLIARFDEIERARIAWALSDSLSNAEGRIAWEWSYDLTALAEMLAATRDTTYARLFIQLGKLVAAQRDDLQGRTDLWRHRPLKAWGATKYSEGKNTVWAVHTGMITAPLARFAGLVLGDSCWANLFAEEAYFFLTIAQEALAVHDAQYRNALEPEEAYLLRMATRLPLNQQAAVARAWLLLDEADGRGKYHERLRKLATYIRNRLHQADDGAYVWSYWSHAPAEGYPGSELDNVAHGALTADFVLLCAERGIVFGPEDVAALARTLLGYLTTPDGRVAKDMSGRDDAPHPAEIFYWGRLARHSPAVAERLRAIYTRLRFDPAGQATEAAALAWLVVARLTPVTPSPPESPLR